jgi:DNA polymerase-3 subunit gamma/tau
VLVGETKLPPQEGRQRSTLNLSNIGKVQKTAEEKPVNTPKERAPDRPIDQDVLKRAWEEFMVLRKNQMAELAVLKRDYVLNATIITVTLASQVEDMVLNTMKTSLITFLRDRTGNSSLMVEGQIVEQANDERKLYTTKDKFEHLAAKNPVLKELKERLGLDPDLA